ncbi:hypothetical protein BABINDRAFT_162673 [Babjeviella inositovora NRRL Y-12698]|uniref:6-phosphofructo-2-kinase domain-containing protein n=1 Tax=Babjeviella inositovora NRRL Y-12698 TaxID=984486 RepID=A0A1E3QL88_9ASCO|nr:uncharacterized protein BABINDRAFT_162673 [Babjeviella inositovora NRRL Y-12698]ODQ78451.1 hypothetical protein BABINDRAFT_162673 [Babjeviella inositovora NRRL Y-12698]
MPLKPRDNSQPPCHNGSTPHFNASSADPESRHVSFVDLPESIRRKDLAVSSFLNRSFSDHSIKSECISPINSYEDIRLQMTRTGSSVHREAEICLGPLESRPESDSARKYVIILVGLPASGKSSFVRSFIKYVGDISDYRAASYNAGVARRQFFNTSAPATSAASCQTHELFDPKNVEGTRQRDCWAQQTLRQLLHELLTNEQDIGIFDATNTTRERRTSIVREIREFQRESPRAYSVTPIFLSVTLSLPKYLLYNIGQKAHNEDYKNEACTEQAVRDFALRYENYCSVYQPFSDAEQTQLADSQGSIGQVSIDNLGEECYFRMDGKAETDDVWQILQFFASNYQIMAGAAYAQKVDRFVGTPAHLMVQRIVNSCSL